MAIMPHGKDPPRRSRREQAVLRAAAMANEYDDNADDAPSHLHQEESVQHEHEHRSTPEPQGTNNDGVAPGLPPSPLVTPPIAALSAPSPAEDPSSDSPSSGKKGVPHIYHDYGQVPDQPGFTRRKTGGVSEPFPEKLYGMLESEHLAGGDIVEWLPHGRAFIVRRPKEFTDHIMPKYFRQTKLTSFQRQLNLYGFRRLTQGPDGGAYYHEMFLRGRPALCFQMKRQKVKGTGHKQPADANTEPNLYAFPSIARGDEELEQTHLHDEETDQIVPPSALSISPHAAAMSPGVGSVTGAAHLLRRIASGERSRVLPPLPFVGLPPSAAMAPESPALVRAPPGRSNHGAPPPRGAFFLRQHYFTTDEIDLSHSTLSSYHEDAAEALTDRISSTTAQSAGASESHPEEPSQSEQGAEESNRFLAV